MFLIWKKNNCKKNSEKNSKLQVNQTHVVDYFVGEEVRNFFIFFWKENQVNFFRVKNQVYVAVKFLFQLIFVFPLF